MNTKLNIRFALLIFLICNGVVDASSRSRSVCPRNYCKNGGVCTRIFRRFFQCICPPGFTGRRCECEMDECATANPCQFNSQCINNIGGPGVTCQCPTGFTGQNCETNIDECATTTCENNGTCVDGINSFICQCPDSIRGRFCEFICKPDVRVTKDINIKFGQDNIPSSAENCTVEICKSINCSAVFYDGGRCFFYVAPVLGYFQFFGDANVPDIAQFCIGKCAEDPRCLTTGSFETGGLQICVIFSNTLDGLRVFKSVTAVVSEKIVSCVDTM